MVLKARASWPSSSRESSGTSRSSSPSPSATADAVRLRIGRNREEASRQARKSASTKPPAIASTMSRSVACAIWLTRAAVSCAAATSWRVSASIASSTAFTAMVFSAKSRNAPEPPPWSRSCPRSTSRLKAWSTPATASARGEPEETAACSINSRMKALRLSSNIRRSFSPDGTWLRAVPIRVAAMRIRSAATTAR